MAVRLTQWRSDLDELNKLGADSHGVVTTKTLSQAGFDSHKLARLVQVGALTREFRGVYRLGFQPATGEQRQVLACAATGGALSHQSAAEYWGYKELACEVVHVTTRRAHCLKRAPWLVRHTTRRPAKRNHVANGLHVVRPLRTLVDLAAAGADDKSLIGYVDHCVARRLFKASEVGRYLDKCRRMPGKRRLRLLLAHLFRSDSALEARAARLLTKAGLPRPVMGYELWANGRFIAKLDMAWPDLKVADETDGYAYHSGWGRFVSDRRRHNAIVAAGWTLTLTTWDEVENDPHGYVERRRAALERAKARLRPGAA
ncbi:MAG TPA: type IV toxin-antitoxin system AbiEi family antitoxin domain-containing protein [Acidimicrobiales bacterium]|jgi:hypothetical protein|nr:type IV toxin-antitoxin system AbiEi family antitoxin domain-containing protein [Acidimicrobiales bacterium]